MPHDHITFGLALCGFGLLATDAARRFAGLRSPALTRLTAIVVCAHVLCVWAFRFDWSAARMWHKSAFAFVLFHGALLLILGSVLAGERHRSRLVLLAFAIVVIGAVPAPFRYPELAMLQIPVVAVFAAAVFCGLRARARTPHNH